MEMNQEQASSITPQAGHPTPTRPRCQHVSRNGKPCRYLGVSPETPFCRNHQPPLPPGSPDELADTLKQMAGNFDTPEGVNQVMYVLFSRWWRGGSRSARRAS